MNFKTSGKTHSPLRLVRNSVLEAADMARAFFTGRVQVSGQMRRDEF